MSLPGGYDPLLGVTSPYPITHTPQDKSRLAASQPEDGVFLQNLAEQLHRSNSPYSASGQTATEIQELLNGLPIDKVKDIDSVSREFESVLLFTMFKQMWETVPDSTLFGNGLSNEIYREMWLEELSGEIAAAGNGIGVADSFKWEMIQRELQSSPPPEKLDLVS